MWQYVIFFGSKIRAWVVDDELMIALAKTPRPTPQHVLAQISDDGPHRWVLPATD